MILFVCSFLSVCVCDFFVCLLLHICSLHVSCSCLFFLYFLQTLDRLRQPLSLSISLYVGCGHMRGSILCTAHPISGTVTCHICGDRRQDGRFTSAKFIHAHNRISDCFPVRNDVHSSAHAKHDMQSVHGLYLCRFAGKIQAFEENKHLGYVL